MKKSGSTEGQSASDPEVLEEWKWGGPVWWHDGILCTGEYKSTVKLTFAKGAAVALNGSSGTARPRRAKQGGFIS